MASKMEFRSRWVLVTGASAGLGEAMARQLAKEGANLVLVARRRERLESLASELQEHGIEVDVLPADLCKADDVERIFSEATAKRSIYAVILNAGVTYFGEALKQSQTEFQQLLMTNVQSLVRLSQLYIPYMVEKNEQGGVMFVSSLGGFSPMPFQAAYGASKAFVTSYGQSLAEEIRDSGVTVSVFAPGGISTEMLDKSGLSKTFKAGDMGIMSAEECGRRALSGFRCRKRVCVPGALNQVSAAAMKIVPTSLVLGVMGKMYRKALSNV
jgi:uncharacterized protein